jgi:hypothetical protein
MGDNLTPSDLVTIHYREPHVMGDSTKFKSTWSILYRVVQKMPNGLNYEVQSTRNLNSLQIVHVLNMRQFYPWTRPQDNEPSKYIKLTDPFPGWTPNADAPPKFLPSEDYEIKSIEDQYQELQGRGKHKRIWYLVCWAGYTLEDDQWVESTKVSVPAIVKDSEWLQKVCAMSKRRRAMLEVLPSDRTGEYGN